MLKLAFTQINAPNYPHLIDQLEFLADLVEDFAEVADPGIPLVLAAEAAFALIYCHRRRHIIPRFLNELAHGDDSSIVRSVLIRHDRDLAAYADRHGLDFGKVTAQP